MRMIYIANARLPTEKAHGLQIMSMCAAFARAGAKVTLVVPRRWGNPIKVKGGAFAYYDIPKTFKIARVPCIDFLWTETKWSFWVQEWTFLASVLVYLWTHYAQVVYSRDLLITLVSKFFFTPLVLEAHTRPPAMLRFVGSDSVRINKLVVVTSFLRDRWVAWGIPKERILVAGDAVDTAWYERLKARRAEIRSQIGVDGKHVIAYVGQLHTMGMSKGIEILLVAFKKVRFAMPNALLYLVGGPAHMVEVYRAQARALGMNEHVRFVGNTTHQVAAEYEVAADVLVAPSPRTDFFTYEASPMKIFEYRAAGRPMVVSDLPAMREAVGDCASVVFVKPEDPDALAQGLLAALGMSLTDDSHLPTWDSRAHQVLDFIGVTKMLQSSS